MFSILSQVIFIAYAGGCTKKWAKKRISILVDLCKVSNWDKILDINLTREKYWTCWYGSLFCVIMYNCTVYMTYEL